MINKIITIVAEVAKEIAADLFLIGATARDIHFDKYKIKANAKTLDIDFGVSVGGMENYEKLKSILVNEKNFRLDPTQQQRIYYQTIPVDLIPFGEEVGNNEKVDWSDGFSMSIVGFQEAYDSSETIEVDSKSIRVVSLCGLFLLKLIAWNELPSRGKDAEDMASILYGYVDAHLERVLEVASENEEDIEQASARLLGRDLKRISSPRTAKLLLEILKRECDERGRLQLPGQMLRTLVPGKENALEVVVNRLNIVVEELSK